MGFQTASYVPPGWLPKPGWPGRVIRFVLGVLLLNGALGIVEGFHQLVFTQQIPDSLILWVLAGLLFLSMRDVIDLGLRVRWGQKARVAVLVLAGVCIALDFIFYRRLWAPPLGLFFSLWFLLVAVPLGLALVLAAVLGTPGCEMRSYADLLARLRGQSAVEHYCPGGIDFVDRWGSSSGK